MIFLSIFVMPPLLYIYCTLTAILKIFLRNFNPFQNLLASLITIQWHFFFTLKRWSEWSARLNEFLIKKKICFSTAKVVVHHPEKKMYITIIRNAWHLRVSQHNFLFIFSIDSKTKSWILKIKQQKIIYIWLVLTNYFYFLLFLKLLLLN